MLTSVLKIIKIGVEYKDAVQAAVDTANEGKSAADVIRTFANSKHRLEVNTFIRGWIIRIA